MSINLQLQGNFITFQEDEVMMGGSCLALLADVDKVLTINPYSHARVPTPIRFTGDGKTIALVEMQAGRLAHATAQEGDVIQPTGEYFLPGPGASAVVEVDVINETGATLFIRPRTRLGFLRFINIGNESEAVEASSDAGVPLNSVFNPLHIPARERPTYGPCGSSIELKADIAYATKLAPGASAVFPTGLSVDVPAGYEAQLRAAGSLSPLITVQNRAISSAAEEVVNVVLTNNSDETVTIEPATTVAQLVVTPVSRPTLIYTAAETSLGENRQGTGN